MAKVLVIDDELNILDVIRAMLESQGHHVTTSLGGEEAKTLIVSGGFDLIITDLRMNPISGMEFLKLAHDECPEAAVILLTAYGRVETAVEALQLGAFDYVAKPFRVDKLLSTVHRALQSSELQKKTEVW